MAKENVRLRLDLDNGTVNGKTSIKRKILNNIKLDANDKSLLKVGNDLGSLQSKSLIAVMKLEETNLTEEA